MKFSSRLDRFGDEVFAALNAKKVALEDAGETVFNLSAGTPDFAPYPHVVEAAREAMADPTMWRYSLRDLPELKQVVCDYYLRRFGVDGITPDMVCSVNGTQEGAGHLAMAPLDPGDLALVPNPCYPVFKAGPKLAGAELAYYPLCSEHDFLPWVAGIGPRIADRATYMMVSLPANPVGSVGTPALYEEIIAFARKHDLLIVHDNAYSDIVFDGTRGGSFLSFPGALEVGVEFFSLSKSFNVTGSRIGFLVGRPDVVAAVSKLRGQIDFGMFLPLQKAVIAALRGPLDSVEQQCLAYQERRDALCDGLESLGWERPNARGSMFVWAKLPGGCTDSVAFCQELIERAHVIANAGRLLRPFRGGLRPYGARSSVRADRARRRRHTTGGHNRVAGAVPPLSRL